ncbi:dehydrogenase/reductase SDR family member 11-like isoform X4 [Ruditapes philippinarum]|uniref:dehydrogenase/reductase SDR family member 11-like isoform X4 n=1 Tax=Ruditapes philippinarum TaxID=129788 RepID=UPI00295B8DD2|nr:dehydrogenase/reductase SDR family member 11-like isoform X4 [Ruditapes philippinarum]
MEKWVGRVALVTGASAGFGESIAKRLVEYGMKVVGCARNIEKIQSLSESLKDSKGSLTAIRCDISKEEEILAMFEKIKKDLGGVDVCINNAGLSYNAPLLSGTTEQWRHMLDINVLGLCICTREAVTSMRERGVDDGHIVLMSSMAGHGVTPNAPHAHFYAATKFAVKALTEGLRNEVCALKSHIRVTAISPGMAKTEFLSRIFSDQPGFADKAYSVYQPLTADDVTDSVIYALAAPSHVQVHDILIRPTECPV